MRGKGDRNKIRINNERERGTEKIREEIKGSKQNERQT
jgi:hypothetical protein